MKKLLFILAFLIAGNSFAESPYISETISAHQMFDVNDDRYLKLGGDNANQTIDIGSENLVTTGSISATSVTTHTAWFGAWPLIIKDESQSNTPINNDIIRFNSTLGHSGEFDLVTDRIVNGFPNRTDSSISWSDGSLRFTINPASDSFDYYDDGRKYTITSSDVATVNTVDITDTEGLWTIYYNGATLTALHSPTDAQLETILLTQVWVAEVYWDATNNKGELFDERHGIEMSPYTHRELHFTAGTTYFDGLALGDFVISNGADDEDAQFSIATGQIFDEDIKHTTNTLSKTTGAEVWYRNAGLDWRKDTQAGFSVLNAGAGRLYYDSAGTLTEVGNAKYVLYHIFAWNAADANPISIMGQNEYGSIIAARIGATTEINSLLLGSLPSPEMKAIGTVIFQTADGYGNTVKAKVVQTDEGDDYVDWRTAGLSPSAAAQDHGSLSGLSDDDHTRYLDEDGTRELTANWGTGGWGMDLEGGTVTGATVTATTITGNTIWANSINNRKTDSTLNATVYLYNDSLTASGDSNDTKYAYGHNLDFNISGTDTNDNEVINSGHVVDLDDTSVVNGASAIHYSIGFLADSTFGGTNTDNANLQMAGGIFRSDGNMGTNGLAQHIGVYGSATDTADANYGVYGVATGAATNNYGGWFSASGGTNNDGVWVDAGDLTLNGGNAKALGSQFRAYGTGAHVGDYVYLGYNDTEGDGYVYTEGGNLVLGGSSGNVKIYQTMNFVPWDTGTTSLGSATLVWDVVYLGGDFGAYRKPMVYFDDTGTAYSTRLIPTQPTAVRNIYIPDEDGVLALKTGSIDLLGDSTTELDVRRTISLLDNTNVTGSGEIKVEGNFSNATNLDYKVEITTGGEVETAVFRWSDDGGGSWDESGITTAPRHVPYVINHGLKVWFEGDTGTDFNVNDYATWTAVGTDNQENTLLVDTTNNQVTTGDIDVEDDTPHVRLTDTDSGQDDYEMYADDNQAYFTNVTDSKIYWKTNEADNFVHETTVNMGSNRITFDTGTNSGQIYASNSPVAGLYFYSPGSVGFSSGTLTFECPAQIIMNTGGFYDNMFDIGESTERFQTLYLGTSISDATNTITMGDPLKFNTDLDIEDDTPHLRLTDTDASQDDYEFYADDNQCYWTNVTDEIVLLKANEADNLWTSRDLTTTGTIQGVTQAEFDTLTDNSMADALHRHSELSASDGTPDANVSVSANGDVTVAAGTLTNATGAAGLMVTGTATSTTANQQHGISTVLTVSPSAASAKLYAGSTGFVGSTSNNLGAGSQITGLYGGVVYTGTGTVADGKGMLFASAMTGGTFTIYRGIHIADMIKIGGTVTTDYGLYVNPIIAGATNYAIFTNAGTVAFGDRVGIGLVAPTGQFHVDQVSTTAAIPVVKLDQGDTSEPFIDYIGTATADANSSISTLDTSGATTDHIQIDLNGVKAWIAVSTNNPV